MCMLFLIYLLLIILLRPWHLTSTMVSAIFILPSLEILFKVMLGRSLQLVIWILLGPLWFDKSNVMHKILLQLMVIKGYIPWLHQEASWRSDWRWCPEDWRYLPYVLRKVIKIRITIVTHGSWYVFK